jgi:hypothetical protein
MSSAELKMQPTIHWNVNLDNQAYYGDHWLFTNIERKAILDIEIFQ